jgi:hypothetical protein
MMTDCSFRRFSVRLHFGRKCFARFILGEYPSSMERLHRINWLMLAIDAAGREGLTPARLPGVCCLQ